MKKKVITIDNLDDLPPRSTAMRGQQQAPGATIEFHAHVPALYAPRITGTVKRSGEEFYVDTAGKLYRRHLYDKMFAVQKGAIKNIRYKGENPNYLLID